MNTVLFFVLAFIGYALGTLVYSATLCQSLISLFCSSVLIHKLKTSENFNHKKAVWKNTRIVLFNLLIFLIATYIIYVFAPSSIFVGYIVGVVLTFLISIPGLGTNSNNISDFTKTFKSCLYAADKEIPIKISYCKKCGQPIDNDTKKCTGCGKQYFNPRKAFKVSIKLFSILIILSLLFSTIYFFNLSNSYSIKLSEQEEIFNSEMDKLKSENIDLKEKYEDEKQKYNSAKFNSMRYLDLMAMLSISSENESFASVNSRIYAVPMGGTEYINVNFKKDTLYMSWLGENISAEWSNDKIKVTGLSKGISTLYISADESGLSEMSIVIICY